MAASKSGFESGKRRVRDERSTLVWHGALCALVIAGCGARTSMLDVDDPSLGSSSPSGGVSGAGSPGAAGAVNKPPPGVAGSPSTTPAGGSPASGFAGSTQVGGAAGIAGFPSSGGSSSGGEAGTSGYAEEACENFCSQVSKSNCPDAFGAYAECTRECTDELGQSDACLQLGQAVMACYLPVFSNPNALCADAASNASRKCATQLRAFQQCGGPTISPPPLPAPPPPHAPVSCSSSGSGSTMTCDLSTKCNDGTYYNVTCEQLAGSQAVCTCSSNGRGVAVFSLNEAISFACYDGISVCGAPPEIPIK